MTAELDHIGIVGPDLDALEAAFGRLGFRVAPRCELVALDENGGATPMGQVNSHLVFGDSYVELTAVRGDRSAHHLRDAIARYWGLHIVVLRTADADAQQARLKRGGSLAPAPALAGRHVSYPGGSGLARFRWFRIPEAEFPEAFLCEVEHLDRDLVFDPALNDHPNGACGLASLSLCCERPQETARRLGDIVGSQARPGDGEWIVDAGAVQVRMLDAAGLAARFPGVTAPGLPWLAAFAVHSRDPGQSAAFLDAAGIAATSGEDRIWASPDRAGGVIVEFLGANSRGRDTAGAHEDSAT
ncbi:MAG: VOC family protein [Rhodobacteraceae bacterium]|nr:VOC family protein [Paracoccaceae bacterium]